jgi:hypothetical protein
MNSHNALTGLLELGRDGLQNRSARKLRSVDSRFLGGMPALRRGPLTFVQGSILARKLAVAMKSLFGMLALLLLPDSVLLAAVPDKALPASNEVEIIQAEFGLFNPPASGKQAFVPTRTVPLTENQAYGWFIVLKTTKARIKWREEFTLPAPPGAAGDAALQSPQALAEAGRLSIVEREVEADDGVIRNVWDVARGDPVGRYVIRVIIENTLERVFEFDVR